MPPRFGPCDVCRGERTIVLALHGGLAVADFDPGASPNDDYKLITPNGEMRRYPCPECTKPPTPPEVWDRYSIVHVNKVVNARLKNNVPYMESMRGNVAALIGRTLLDRGLVSITQHKAPPMMGEFDNVVIQGIVGVVHPDGEEVDRVIQDIDPKLRPERSRDGPDPRMMFGSQPEPREKLRTRRPAPWDKPEGPRTARELIFEDEDPDAQGK